MMNKAIEKRRLLRKLEAKQDVLLETQAKNKAALTKVKAEIRAAKQKKG